MTPGQIIAAITLAITIGFGGAWQVQDWRYAGQLASQAALQADNLNNLSQVVLRQQKTERNKRLAMEQQLATQDQQHTRALSYEQRKQTLLRDRLATADVRLSVLLDAADTASGCDVPTPAGAVGVVHGAARAQLDPAHAQRIFGIIGDGDQGLIALRACQAYVREVTQ